MNSHDDENQNVVYGILFFVIALVLFLTMGLAIRSKQVSPPNKLAVASSAVSVEDPVVFSVCALTGEPLVKIYFAVGETSPGAEAQPELAKVLAVLQAQKDAIVLISGFHDETGSAQVNAEVSKERAVSVRELLVAHGIVPERIQLSRPAVALGGEQAEEARRVEVRVLDLQ